MNATIESQRGGVVPRRAGRPDESPRVLFVHGPGGTGKTTLLSALADAGA